MALRKNSRLCRSRHLSLMGPPLVHITDDPQNSDRVIVTDIRGDRANMTITAVRHTCTFADHVILETNRVGWDR